jgi:hypothetical protein
LEVVAPTAADVVEGQR